MFKKLIQRAAAVAPALLLIGAAATAQTLVQQGRVQQGPSPFTPITTLSGTVFDGGGGGPLLAGRTYHVIGTITVPALETLTIRRGAVLKFTNGARLNVNGHLDVRGKTGRRVRFTSYLDDSLGGDTFGDGPTVGAPGNWGGILANPGGSIDIKFADLRFGGSGGYHSIYGKGGRDYPAQLALS